MILKRLLTAWFLVFTLINSVAVTYAGHGDENHGGPVLDAPWDQGTPLPWQNDDCSDHCCHAASHVVALVGRTGPCVARSSLSEVLALSDTQPDSLPLPPPYHPPIA